MLRKLQQHPLLASAAEVAVDGARYIAAVLILMILVGQLARLLGAGI